MFSNETHSFGVCLVVGVLTYLLEQFFWIGTGDLNTLILQERKKPEEKNTPNCEQTICCYLMFSRSLSLSLYVYHVYVNITIYIYISIYIYIHAYIYIYTYLYTYTYVYICMCMFICIYIYVERERERTQFAHQPGPGRNRSHSAGGGSLPQSHLDSEKEQRNLQSLPWLITPSPNQHDQHVTISSRKAWYIIDIPHMCMYICMYVYIYIHTCIHTNLDCIK